MLTICKQLLIVYADNLQTIVDCLCCAIVDCLLIVYGDNLQLYVDCLHSQSAINC